MMCLRKKEIPQSKITNNNGRIKTKTLNNSKITKKMSGRKDLVMEDLRELGRLLRSKKMMAMLKKVSKRSKKSKRRLLKRTNEI